MTAYHIRTYREGDEKAILSAFAHVFPVRRSLPTWQWIYRDHPDGSHIMLCSLDDGQLAAHFAVTRHRAVFHGQPLIIAQPRDAFSLPRYRSKMLGRSGLFVKTAEALFNRCGWNEGVAFHYGFPSPRHLKLGQKQLGYHEGLNWSRYRFDAGRPTPSGAPLGELREIARFGEEFDRLWQEREKEHTLAVVHDSRFLTWRFDRRSGRRYWVWGFFPHLTRDMSGYAIFSHSGTKALLLDFHFPRQPGCTPAFWRQIVEKLRWHGISEVETWFSDHTTARAGLIELGFEKLPQPEQTTLCYRFVEGGPGFGEVDPAFYFTMADCDLF
ncbi:MAG: hypothetical protein WC091_09325 [Sulfuricellaceae bacterium]